MRKKGGKRQSYEVRVREKTGPYKWELLSKFYFARDAGEARSQYDGKGQILHVSKVSAEKVGKFGDFFRLGDRLLREFADERAKEQGEVIKRQEAVDALSSCTPQEFSKKKMVVESLTK